MKHVKCYKKDYPRPQFVRENFVSLNGIWDFEFDEQNVGERLEYFKNHQFSQKIKVPFVYQSKASGIGSHQLCENIWYKSNFAINTQKDERVILHFDGVDYIAKVWLNGVFIGCHKGGYTRFSFDITNYLKRENTLVVKCEDSLALDIPRGKQSWTNKKEGCFYTNNTGIWKTVWLEKTASSFIKQVEQDMDFDRATVTLNYTIDGETDGLTFEATLSFDDDIVCVQQSEVLDVYGSLTLSFENKNKVLPIIFWSSRNPALYDLTYTLKKDGKIIDYVGSYTSLVKYAAHGNNILVNDWPTYYFKMVLNQGYYPDSDLTPKGEIDLVKDIELIKEMGFNGVRMHQKIEDDRFYYLCDVYGLYVWVEMPSPYSFRQSTVKNVMDEWLKIVAQYKSHPSVMAFLPLNESWGTFQILSNKQQQSFADALYHATKAICPQKFCISNDGWEHTTSDIITLHNYTRSGDGIVNAYGDLGEFLSGNVTQDLHTKSAMAEGYQYQGQPVMISELAGIAYKKTEETEGWGYGETEKNIEQFLKRYEGIIKGVKSLKGVIGYCTTQLCDVMHEINGLLYEDRTPKADLKKIKEIHDKY